MDTLGPHHGPLRNEQADLLRNAEYKLGETYTLPEGTPIMAVLDDDYEPVTLLSPAEVKCTETDYDYAKFKLSAPITVKDGMGYDKSVPPINPIKVKKKFT